MYPTINTLLETAVTRRSVAMTADEALAWLKANAPKQLAYYKTISADGMHGTGMKALWRGTGAFARVPESGAMLTDPTKAAPRGAMNTGDLYRIVLDEANPDWPSRGQGIIGTTDDLYASGYGTLYVMIPEDGATVGAVGRQDMWDSGTILITRLLESYFRELAPMIMSDAAPEDVKTEFRRFSNMLLAPGRDKLANLDPAKHDRSSLTVEQWRQALSDLKTFATTHVRPISAAAYDRRMDNYVEYAPKMGSESVLAVGAAVASSFATWAAAREFDLMQSLITRCKYDAMKSFSKGSPREIADSARGEVWTDSPCLLITPRTLQEIVGWED